MAELLFIEDVVGKTDEHRITPGIIQNIPEEATWLNFLIRVECLIFVFRHACSVDCQKLSLLRSSARHSVTKYPLG
jgi:hypothetical protein